MVGPWTAAGILPWSPALPARRDPHPAAIRRRAAPGGADPLLLTDRTSWLLDEPTNTWNAESVAWLEPTCASTAATVIAVTHDRYSWIDVAWLDFWSWTAGFGIP